MKFALWLGAFATVAAISLSASGQAPSGSTGQCKDGTYTAATHKAGACSGHKGVGTWYAADGAAAPSPAKSTPATSAPQSSPYPGASPAPTPSQKSAPANAPEAAARPQAAGGGPGMVWVNTASKVYHCQGARFYGTTKNGKYLSESAAVAEGDRPDHGKSCSK